MDNKKIAFYLIRQFFIISFIVFTILSFKSIVHASMTVKLNTNIPNPDTEVRLDFASVYEVVYYNVLRDDIKIATININSDINNARYIDKNLIPEKTYKYTVQGLNASETILESVNIWASTSSMLTPVITSAIYDINNNKVTLSWTNHSKAATQAKVYNADGEEVAIVPVTSGSCTFSDYYVTNEPTKGYFIELKDNYGHISGYSNTIYISKIESPAILASASNGMVIISWASNRYISYFQLEMSKYEDGLWTAWKIVQGNIAYGTTSITLPYEEGSICRYRLASNQANYIGYSNISNVISMPKAPEEIILSQNEPGKIRIEWELIDGIMDHIFKIERRLENDSVFKTIATLSSDTTYYEDIDGISTNKTYVYRIAAYDTNNNFALSSEESIFTGIPAPAKNLYIAVVSSEKIVLNWTDKSNNEQYFRIDKKIDDEDYIMWVPNIPANTTNYVDEDISNDHTYTYRVIPYNVVGYADTYSNEASYIPFDLDIQPAASLNATALSLSEIQLEWGYTEDGGFGSCIERKMEGESWEFVEVLGKDITTYIDKGLKPNTKYSYRIRGVISDNVYSIAYPEDTEEISVTTMLPTPENLNGEWSKSSKISLKWDSVSGSVGYIIERGTSSDSFDVVAKASANSFTDSGVEFDREYYYRIKAFNRDTESTYSGSILLKPQEFLAPDELTYIVISGKEVLLSWKDNTSNEDGFIVQRKVNEEAPWVTIASLEAGVTSFLDKNVKPDGSYIYLVKAFNSIFEDGMPSVELNVTIETMEAPSDLALTAVSPTEVKLTWKDNSEDEQGFIIERKGRIGEFAEIHRVDENVFEYTDLDLTPKTKYFYRVKAYSDNIETEYSNEASITTNKSYTFDDIGDMDWAKDAIISLANKGIIKGKSSTRLFAPNDKITRAEFITLIVRALKLNSRANTVAFNDVNTDQWFYNDIMIAKGLGIVAGIGGNYFYPDRLITRQDMAVIITRAFAVAKKAFKVHSTSSLSGFNDVSDISDYAVLSVATLCGEKIISGKYANIIAPRDYAIRAETAVILFRALGE